MNEFEYDEAVTNKPLTVVDMLRNTLTANLDKLLSDKTIDAEQIVDEALSAFMPFWQAIVENVSNGYNYDTHIKTLARDILSDDIEKLQKSVGQLETNSNFKALIINEVKYRINREIYSSALLNSPHEDRILKFLSEISQVLNSEFDNSEQGKRE